MTNVYRTKNYFFKGSLKGYRENGFPKYIAKVTSKVIGTMINRGCFFIFPSVESTLIFILIRGIIYCIEKVVDSMKIKMLSTVGEKNVVSPHY